MQEEGSEERTEVTWVDHVMRCCRSGGIVFSWGVVVVGVVADWEL